MPSGALNLVRAAYIKYRNKTSVLTLSNRSMSQPFSAQKTNIYIYKFTSDLKVNEILSGMLEHTVIKKVTSYSPRRPILLVETTATLHVFSWGTVEALKAPFDENFSGDMSVGTMFFFLQWEMMVFVGFQNC